MIKTVVGCEWLVVSKKSEAIFNWSPVMFKNCRNRVFKKKLGFVFIVRK